MIFRNSFRLLVTNFSNVWKVLLYFIICVGVTVGVCWFVLAPIVEKLAEANVFEDIVSMLNNIFLKTDGVIASTINSLNEIISKTWEVLSSNLQFTFNYVFLIVWIVFVFPIMLDLSCLTLGEVFYGYMTSHVKYGYTGRFLKNIGKSLVFSLTKYLVQFVFNAIILALFVLMIKFFTLGNIFYVIIDFALLFVLILFMSLKLALFSCWMPGIAVLNLLSFRALGKNFKIVFSKFFNILSNSIVLVLTLFVFNFLFLAYTFGIGLIVSLPITCVILASFQMVTYFTCQGMRYYVYPDNFVSPKKFEERDGVKRVKHLI